MPAVVVTGSAGSIGAALIEEFKAADYFTIGLDQYPTSNAHAELVVDLERIANDPDAGEALGRDIERIVQRQELHALVNNAAIQLTGPSNTFSLADFRRSLDVNLIAAFRLTQLCFDRLEKARGSVVNIGSIHSRLTKPDFVAYATSKAALEGMGRAMAVEFGDRVRVNTIRPAAISTEMLRAGFASAPSRLSELASFHPMGRIGEPAEVARLAVFLAGNGARFLSGTCIDLDGAIGARLHDPS
jgi:NAD(P)-dependent dehydrogenase (short-subunit alcohol dehydrogenase family)